MKKTGTLGTILLFLGALLAPCSVTSAADIYYQLSEVTTSPATWIGTDADRLKPPTADYDYTYGDEAGFIYNLPWTFYFHGQPYTRIYVDTNGNVWFTTPGSAHSFSLANTGRGPVIAAWNNDLSSYYYGGVFVQHKTTTDGDAVVIEWQTETYTDEGYSRLNNFETVLFADSRIRIDYKAFNPSNQKDFGSGISMGDGANFLNLPAPPYTLASRSFIFKAFRAINVTSPATSFDPVGKVDNFGNVFVNGASASHTYTIANAGSDNLTLIASTINGVNAGEFNIDATTCIDNTILPPSQYCTMVVSLRPITIGTKAANLAVSSDDPHTPSYIVSLSGSGIQPKLTVTKSGTGTGTVTSAPDGISCGSSCTSIFTTDAILLSAVPAVGTLFSGWSGGCTGTDGCAVTLSADMSVNAKFDLGNAAKLLSSGAYYNTLQAAFAAAADGDTIMSRNVATTENVNINSGNAVTLVGGYDSSYSNVTGSTSLAGSLTITNGAVTADNLTIR